MGSFPKNDLLGVRVGFCIAPRWFKFANKGATIFINNFFLQILNFSLGSNLFALGIIFTKEFFICFILRTVSTLSCFHNLLFFLVHKFNLSLNLWYNFWFSKNSLILLFLSCKCTSFVIISPLLFLFLTLITKRVNICFPFPWSDLGHCHCIVNVYIKPKKNVHLFVSANKCKFSPWEEAHHLFCFNIIKFTSKSWGCEIRIHLKQYLVFNVKL